MLKYDAVDRILIVTVLDDLAIDVEVFDVNLARTISRHSFNTGWRYVLALIQRTTREWADCRSAIVIHSKVR